MVLALLLFVAVLSAPAAALNFHEPRTKVREHICALLFVQLTGTAGTQCQQ